LNYSNYQEYLKIWIDILTPKQLLFSESIVEKLGKKHDLLSTSRQYDEVSKLAKIRKFQLECIGKYGGREKKDKLEASIDRIEKLLIRIKKFSPDLIISFCSPDAARISFGLGIKHIAFCDSPHANAVMRLTLPLIQKLLIPNIIPKNEFSKFGIDKKNIISYKAIDASVTIKRKIDKKIKLPFKNNQRKNILIRLEEDQAAYASKSKKNILIVKKILEIFEDENIVILSRYTEQIKEFRKELGKKSEIIKMSYDGKYLLENTDVFVGSGGTMTAESALLGIPTISYNAIPNIIENYLFKKNLINRKTNPNDICDCIKKIFKTSNKKNKNRAKKIRSEMEDPIQKLMKIINK